MELDELGFIHLLAVDQGSVVTVSHPDREDAPPEIRRGRGGTPAAALADVGHGNERVPFLGGASYLLIGEGQAREDVSSALDLIFSDYAARMDVYVYVVRDGTASEWVQGMAESSQPVLEWMHNFGQRTKLGSPALRVKVCGAVAGMAEGETVLLPAVSMPREADQTVLAVEDQEEEGGEEHVNPLMSSRPAGYAVVRDGCVAGWIEPEDCPIADAMLLGRKRVAPIAVPGGGASEAEYTRRGPSSLRVTISSSDGTGRETPEAFERILLEGLRRIGRVIEGFESVTVEVAFL